MKKDRNSTLAAISVQSDPTVTAPGADAVSRTNGEKIVYRDHAGNESGKRRSCFKRTIFIGLIGARLCSSVSFGETLPFAQVDAQQSDVRVFVDGLGCNTVAQATFGAVSFRNRPCQHRREWRRRRRQNHRERSGRGEIAR
jgi:hypothetical protein